MSKSQYPPARDLFGGLGSVLCGANSFIYLVFVSLDAFDLLPAQHVASVVGESVPQGAGKVRFAIGSPAVVDPRLAEAHAQLVARMVGIIGCAAVEYATVVHPQ